MLTEDEITSKNYDELMSKLCPWGSLDVWHMIKKAESLNLYMYELADILFEQAENFGISLYGNNTHTTDVNALFNDYILQQARCDIENVLNIDICNDCDIYFFANYLDDPLQYHDSDVEKLEDKIQEYSVTKEDFNKFSLYLFGEMGINLED